MTTLNNKRNTKIIEEMIDHLTRNTKVCVARKLLHHGSNTCTIVTQLDGSIQVEIDLCGFDTVTTRRKINEFMKRYLPFTASLHQARGKTLLTHYAQTTGTMIPVTDRAYITRGA